jgi:hypothetical protein
MGIQGVHLKGVLSLLVSWASLEGTTDFCPALAALVWHCTKYFFLTSHCFTLLVPIAQQAGQAVVLRRLALNKCLWSQILPYFPTLLEF